MTSRVSQACLRRCRSAGPGEARSGYCWLSRLRELCTWSTGPYLHSVLYRSSLNCSAEWLVPASKGKGTQWPCSEIDGCTYLYRSNPRVCLLKVCFVPACGYSKLYTEATLKLLCLRHLCSLYLQKCLKWKGLGQGLEHLHIPLSEGTYSVSSLLQGELCELGAPDKPFG